MVGKKVITITREEAALQAASGVDMPKSLKNDR